MKCTNEEEFLDKIAELLGGLGLTYSYNDYGGFVKFTLTRNEDENEDEQWNKNLMFFKRTSLINIVLIDMLLMQKKDHLLSSKTLHTALQVSHFQWVLWFYYYQYDYYFNSIWNIKWKNIFKRLY